MSTELFSVYQFFADGTNECVKQFVGMEEAVRTAFSYTIRPAALAGIIRRVMITDDGDCSCFEWEFGKGVVWPHTGSDGKFTYEEPHAQ